MNADSNPAESLYDREPSEYQKNGPRFRGSEISRVQ